MSEPRKDVVEPGSEPTKRQPKPNPFVRWKHSWSGRCAWLVLDLVIAYIFGTLAIDTGALWQYGLAVFFLADGIYNFVQLVRRLINYGNKTTKA